MILGNYSYTLSLDMCESSISGVIDLNEVITLINIIFGIQCIPFLALTCNRSINSNTFVAVWPVAEMVTGSAS